MVPMYQRPFSWTVEDVSELWLDINKNKPPYFLGILFFQKKEGNETFMVVDGQQRLATLLLLLRSAVEVLGKDDELGKELQTKYINQKGWGEEEAEFTLTLSERDKYNFSTLLSDTIYLPPMLSPKEKKGRKIRRRSSPAKLKNVKDFFLQQMRDLMDQHGKEGIVSLIKNKVLTVNFIEVQVDSDSDVYTFFETLNARGIDLTVADMLKNRVCNVSENPYNAATEIDEITDTVGEGKMNSFLLHYCSAISTDKEPPTKKSLMYWYGKTIEAEKDNFLTSLENYAEIYSTFLDPGKNKSTELKDVLRCLKVLGATRCYPLLLVGSEFLPPKEFLKLCEAIETLTFRHSTISSKDAKILESEYYKLSQVIKHKKSINGVIEKLNQLAKEIPDEVFEVNFKIYEATNQIGKYILLKIDNLLSRGSAKLDWEDLTLEHILPEGSDWEGRDTFWQRLGNMTLLTGKSNKSAGNRDFKTKKKEYGKESRIKLTQELADYDEFTKEDIQERQKRLAKLALEIWKV